MLRKPARTLSRLVTLSVVAAALLLLFAPGAFALFTNGSFENGDLGGWTRSSFLNPALSGTAPFTGASIVRNAGGTDLTQIRGPYARLSQADANTGNALHYPLSGSYCSVINFQGSGRNANSLKQQSTTAAGSVASDGKIHVQFAWAGVVQNPAHGDNQQPYIYVVLRNVTKGTVLYEAFHFAGAEAIWHNAANSIQYTDWQVTDIAPSSSQLAIGDTVEIEAVAAGCSQSGHWGYLYVDRFGSFQPVTPQITVADKNYDGSTGATITGRSLSGVVSGDDVSLVGGTATFHSAAPGHGKTVNVSGLTLTGADADRYQLTSFSTTTTADIIDLTAPTTTATGLVANDHVWQGSSQTVTLSADDGPGTVDATYYTLDGGPQQTYAGPFDVSGEGTHVVTYWSVDTFGNTEAANTGHVNIDLGAPTTTADGLAADTTSWTDQAQTVTLDADDGAGSGVAATYYTLDGGPQQTYAGPFDVSGEGTHVVTYWSVDTFGNTEAANTGHVNIDLGAPTTTADGLAADTTSWTDQAQTVTLDADDGAGSGVAATYYTLDGGPQQTYAGPFDVSGEGTHVVTYWSVDIVGNTEEAGVGYVSVDTTAPVTTATGVQPDAHSGHVLLSQTVTLDADDGAGSGVAATYYTLDGGPQQTYAGPFDVSGEGTHVVTYWSVDALDNTEEAQTGYVNIVAPDDIVTTATGLTADDDSGWTNEARTVTLSATGGFGELTTYYTVDGGPQQTYAGPFEVGGEGTHIVTYWSVDEQPVSETAGTGYVNLDETPPVTVTDASTAWRRTTIAALLEATDSGSGVAATYYRIDDGELQTGSTVVVPALADHTMDGLHAITYYSEDNAGNVELAKERVVRIDTTRPRIKLTKTLFEWKRGNMVRVKYRVADATVDEVTVQLRITQYGNPKSVAYKLGLKRCGHWYVAAFKCKLKPHHYNLHMRAWDYAGNLGHKSGLIVVRK